MLECMHMPACLGMPQASDQVITNRPAQALAYIILTSIWINSYNTGHQQPQGISVQNETLLEMNLMQSATCDAHLSSYSTLKREQGINFMKSTVCQW
jgi:hypothetical protein